MKTGFKVLCGLKFFQMKSINVFFVAIVSVLLFSCKKQDQPAPVPVAESKLLKKISTSDREFELFTYNANKQLIKLTSQYIDDHVSNTVATDESLFTYQGNLLSKVQHESGSMEFYYTNGRVDSIKNFTENYKLISTDYPQFNAQGQLISVTTNFSGLFPLMPVAMMKSFVYNAEGNLIENSYSLKVTRNSDYVFQEKTVFSNFDNKPNPEPFNYLDFYFPGVTFLKNNPGKVKVYNHNNVLESDMTVSYEYNTAGYITKKTIATAGSANPEISFFEYY